MRLWTLQFSLIALLFLPKPSLGAAANTIGGFDLFGFKLTALDQGLGKRANSLGQALATAFPKDFKAQDFKENYYNGHCFVSGPDQYKLSWRDSETEGFEFKVERLKDQKNCASPFSEGQSFKGASLQPAQFFPVSRSHPDLQLGVSTPAQVQKELGKPAYASPTKLIYVLKRDMEKEKGCGSKPSEGDFYGIELQLGFANGVLQSMDMVNSIAGEC